MKQRFNQNKSLKLNPPKIVHSYSHESDDEMEDENEVFRRKLAASASFKRNFPSVNDEPDELQNMNLTPANSLMKSVSLLQVLNQESCWQEHNICSSIDESELNQNNRTEETESSKVRAAHKFLKDSNINLNNNNNN